MDEKSEQSPYASQKILIQKDFWNIDTACTYPEETAEEMNRTRRVKKPKLIEDLGFERKPTKNKKTLKKMKSFEHTRDINIISKFNKKAEPCYQIFRRFKEHELYPKFHFFNQMERNVRQNQYTTHQNLAEDIRKIFNNYFTANVNDPQSYSDTFKFSNYFEDIYRDYENKTFNKESKNILELKKKMNRLRKEIRERNNPIGTLTKNTKLRIDINDYNLFSEKEKKISRKYKMNLVNNIRSLNADQVKGIINIIHDNLNVEEKTMEFDINNLPIEKLKELDKYVKKCLKTKSKPTAVMKDDYSKFNQAGVDNTGINVNININNNFMMGNFKVQNNIAPDQYYNNIGLNLKKRNSILSDSDSLSSDEESDSNSLSSMSFENRK